MSSKSKFLVDLKDQEDESEAGPSNLQIIPTISLIESDSELDLYNDDEVNEAFQIKGNTTKRKLIGPKEKITRNKKRTPDNWKRNKAAKAREKGETYVSQTGKIIPAKEIKDGCLCNDRCRLKCSEKFNLTERKAILQEYYGLDVNAKNTLLFNNISIEQVNRHKNKAAEKPKQYTFRYSVTFNGRLEPVCKEALCSLYQFSRKKIEIIQRQLKLGQCEPAPDNRGRHENRPHKLKPEVVDRIIMHIKKFPAENPYYSETNKLYLSPLLNLSTMYKLYLEDCNENQLPEYFYCTRSSYGKIFSTKFNLSFGRPKGDTCATCDSGNDSEQHQEKYKLAFEMQQRDRQFAIEHQNVCYVMMDLLQTLPLPKLATPEAFYLRQMWLYNFGLDTITHFGNESYVFNWTEDAAAGGSSEILSCLNRFVETKPNNTDHLIVWSGSSSGENKNFSIIGLYQYFLLKGYFKCIDHKYPELGHSFLDSDRDVGVGRIEQLLRSVGDVYVPEQYRDIIRNASKTNLVIQDMSNYFVDIDDLMETLQLLSRETNTLGQKVIQDNIRWVRVTNYGSYLYKESLNEEDPFKAVNILKTDGTRKINTEDTGNILKFGGEQGKISNEKLIDLREQLQYIKPEYHWFYEELSSNNTSHSKKEIIL